MKYYTVIDTNALVSAMLKWNSVPGNIMELSFSGPIIPVLNEAIVKEYREVLLRPKFHFTEEIVSDVIDTITEKGVYVDADSIDIELPNPKDRVFYEVVMEKTEGRKRLSCHRKHKTFSCQAFYRNTQTAFGYHFIRFGRMKSFLADKFDYYSIICLT